MSDTPVDSPIVVNPNPLPAQALVAVRSLLILAGGIAVGRGWLTNEQLSILVGAILVLGPIIYQQFASRRNTAKLATLAEAAPNTVAVVKS